VDGSAILKASTTVVTTTRTTSIDSINRCILVTIDEIELSIGRRGGWDVVLT
jgi:hypothetical protein